MKQDLDQMLHDFYKMQADLTAISSKKRQLSLQLASTKHALQELDKTEEEKVYQIISNIMFHKNVKEVKEELDVKKEQLSVQIASLQSEWESLMEKFKDLSLKIKKGSEMPSKDNPFKSRKFEKGTHDDIDMDSLMAGNLKNKD